MDNKVILSLEAALHEEDFVKALQNADFPVTEKNIETLERGFLEEMRSSNTPTLAELLNEYTLKQKAIMNQKEVPEWMDPEYAEKADPVVFSEQLRVSDFREALEGAGVQPTQKNVYTLYNDFCKRIMASNNWRGMDDGMKEILNDTALIRRVRGIDNDVYEGELKPANKELNPVIYHAELTYSDFTDALEEYGVEPTDERVRNMVSAFEKDLRGPVESQYQLDEYARAAAGMASYPEEINKNDPVIYSEELRRSDFVMALHDAGIKNTEKNTETFEKVFQAHLTEEGAYGDNLVNMAVYERIVHPERYEDEKTYASVIANPVMYQESIKLHDAADAINRSGRHSSDDNVKSLVDAMNHTPGVVRDKTLGVAKEPTTYEKAREVSGHDMKTERSMDLDR